MGEDNDEALVHALSNLNLLNAQSIPAEDQDAATQDLKKSQIISSAAPALAGMDPVLDTLREVIGWPVLYAKEAAELGVRWPRGILLHGPSGVGKSSAVAAVASEFNAIVHLVTAGAIVGSYVGESERRLREVFEAARRDAASPSPRPVIIFLDEVDTLCPRRSPGQQHEARIVGQLLTLLDGAESGARRAHHDQRGQRGKGHVVVVAATSRPNALDPALRRPGRLDREVAVPVPDVEARKAILRVLVEGNIPIDSSVNLDAIAATCHGYTGADLQALCREAASEAFSDFLDACDACDAQKSPEDENILSRKKNSDEEDSHNNTLNEEALLLKLKTPPMITGADFVVAVSKVGASVARSVVKEFPPATWDDVGGLEAAKKRLKQAVEWPINRADAMRRLGITAPRGVLLHGPPGCAKTTLARAAATSSGATFIPLQGASLYSMYVGEGEAELREAFHKARLAAPAIIFVDELDMLVGKRGSTGGTGTSGGGSTDASARLLSTFLNEMDGLELATGVLVLATTNRPTAIDTALLRPGRFDVTIYVPPPDFLGRVQTLRVHTRGMPLASDVDLEVVAEATERCTGAELAAVCREAAMAALREDLHGAMEVAKRHFDAAVNGIVPMLTEEELERYEEWPPKRAVPTSSA